MDGLLRIIGEHGFEVLQSTVLVLSLIFSGLAFRADTKARRIGNLINFTSNHREIWSEFYRRPELARIFRSTVNLSRKPITGEEEMFVISLILHLRASHAAISEKLVLKPHGICLDVQWLFSFPITKTVWDRIKSFQDSEFVQFVEDCLN